MPPACVWMTAGYPAGRALLASPAAFFMRELADSGAVGSAPDAAASLAQASPAWPSSVRGTILARRVSVYRCARAAWRHALDSVTVLVFLLRRAGRQLARERRTRWSPSAIDGEGPACLVPTTPCRACLIESAAAASSRPGIDEASNVDSRCSQAVSLDG